MIKLKSYILIRNYPSFIQLNHNLRHLPAILVFNCQYILKLDVASCLVSQSDAVFYPDCLRKMHWMEKGWKTHKCYAFYGANGTACSSRIYLSEVERHCPVLPWRDIELDASSLPVNKRALIQRDLSRLFALMLDSKQNYLFIQSRISRLWTAWLNAYDTMVITWPKLAQPREKLNIIVHMGFLSKEANFKFGKLSSFGGPLGELVQWSDLIAALYILGHNLLISTEINTLEQNIKKFDYNYPCPLQNDKAIGLFFTDIVGLIFLRRKMFHFFNRIKCVLRILDSFGTHAEFNSKNYFKAHKISLGGSESNPWGNHHLNLQQFMTMFPHTDDNTFLGFVVEIYPLKKEVKRENATLVYGKEKYMWKSMEQLIEIVQNFTEVHATVADGVPNFTKPVINHGILSGPQVQHLLQKVKIFLGLGFPFEGPAPLEAIANGAIYINPSFNPPKSRKTSKFFADKPTLRELTSQNPYAELFIGKPYVLTVDIQNSSQVENAIQEALLSKPKAFIPFEFTVLGMLQRVTVLTSKQNFCYPSRFPPFQAFRFVKAASMQSCQSACYEHNLRCERSFFRFVNTPEFVNSTGRCVKLKAVSNPDAPYACSQQRDPDLYSCATVPTATNIRRICPCRDFLHHQSALCLSCL
ncbi:unnamed protein product [Thelazia callipaeda]|uniref:alpha-1,6-mannosyl-glycoprotein 6-beta-N-acetylglucosaminyltransferase n=1 Tax=Thelazia callipaeda TaxID=103827 RepID=A0A0N5CJP3_THECL|nr:unnamed protein product [Thelazia callipaeda]